MDQNKATKTQTELEMEEYLRENKDTFYKKSSADVGSRIHESQEVKRVAINSGFTNVK
jgi:hypothetical protein